MPGPLPGQQVASTTMFGISDYGTSYYGIGLPPDYLVEPMTAVSNSYTSILVTWHPPAGVIFRYRLVRNRYGFPVNENDGDIIYDTTVYPGNSYTDLDINPGTYHYYGFYVLAEIAGNLWIRSGFAGCLAVQDYASGQWLFDLLPEYFTTIPETGAALTDDAAGNSQLQLFLNVFGWALDYLRTQYGTYANHLNDAWFIPLDDLWNLAAQVGLTFSPDVPAYTVRKATENFAHVAQQRGTLAGIAEEIALRTGYGADVHMGPNILLDDDQAQILSPVFLQYQATRSYDKDECVWVPHSGQPYWWRWNGDGWWFRSLVNSNLGNTPPAGGTSNSYWQALYDSDDFLATQVRIDTDNPSTWEILDTGATNYLPLPHSATQGLGVLTPPAVNAGANAYAWNTLRFYNRQAGTRTLWCRSVSRRDADLGQIPDPSFEAGTTIAPANKNRSDDWVPRWWPKVTIDNWLGGDDDIDVPRYWTPVNALFSREDTTAHTGSWAMQVAPTGAATPITAPAAVQYANPGFEAPSLTGWTGTNCEISQSNAQAHTGNFSLLIAPSFILADQTGTLTYLPPDNPFATGPRITAIAGASDTVTVYCYGTKTPAGATSFPAVIAAIQYYDTNGNVLQTTEGSSTLLAASWTSVTASATAPAGAVTKALIIVSDPAHVANMDNFYADDISWGQTVTESWAALQGNSPWIECPATTAVTGSAWYYATAAGSSITAQIVFYDQAGNVLATDAGTPVTGTLNTWVNPTCSGTAPAGSQFAALEFTVTSPVTLAYVDDTTVTPTATYSNQPDQIQAVQDGIPVPWVLAGQEWNPATRYVTNDIVHYDNQPFIALRASTGSLPPPNDVATTDWAPLSQSPRIRLCLSGYTSQNLTNAGTYTYAVTPFIEWYDAQGNFIARIFARSAAGNGTVSQPANMAYDSFTTESVIASPGVSSGSAALGPWNASFWNNTAMSGAPVLTRVDPAVNFTWDGIPPGFGVRTSGWSANWITTYTAPAAGSYGFSLQAGQGGTRLIVNGQTLIDNWAAQSSATLTATLTLAAGQVITVEIDYTNPQLNDYDGEQISYGTITTGEWFSGKITIAPGQQLTVSGSVYVVSISPPHPTVAVLQILWYDHSGNTVKTSAPFVPATNANVPFDLTYTAPDRTTYAQIVLVTSALGSSGPHIATWTDVVATVPVPVAVNSDSILFSNVTTPAIPAAAAQYSYNLAGRVTDDEQSQWTNPLSSVWTVGGFAGGSVWPANPAVQAIGLITTQPANTSLGVTYRSLPQGGAYAGIIFRYSSTSNYWRSDQVQLGYVQSGVYTLVAAHSQAFLPGDRMTITLNGTAITVYRNGVQVNSATSSFNQSSVSHGIINDVIASAEAAAADPLRKHAIKSKTPMPPRRGQGSPRGIHR